MALWYDRYIYSLQHSWLAETYNHQVVIPVFSSNGWFALRQMHLLRSSAMRARGPCGTGPSRPCCWCWTRPSSSWFMKAWRGIWGEEFPGRWGRRREGREGVGELGQRSVLQSEQNFRKYGCGEMIVGSVHFYTIQILCFYFLLNIIFTRDLHIFVIVKKNLHWRDFKLMPIQ